MVWGTGLITASSLPVNDASPSENQSQSLAGVITEKKEHHYRDDDIRHSQRQSSRKELFSLKAHLTFKNTFPLPGNGALMFKRWPMLFKGDGDNNEFHFCSRSFVFFQFHIYSLSFPTFFRFLHIYLETKKSHVHK